MLFCETWVLIWHDVFCFHKNKNNVFYSNPRDKNLVSTLNCPTKQREKKEKYTLYDFIFPIISSNSSDKLESLKLMYNKDKSYTAF